MKVRAVGLALIASVALGVTAAAGDVSPSAPERKTFGIAERPNPAEQREILVIFSDDPTQPWTQRVAEGLSEVAMRQSSGSVLYFEYMDASRFRAPADLEHFRDWLHKKYDGRDIDVVVPLGEPSLRFAAQYRDTLWPGTDVYFMGLQEPDDSIHARLPNAGGIVLGDNVAETLRVLKDMLPRTKRVAVVRGMSVSERGWAHSIPSIARSAGLEMVDVPALTVAEVQRNVARLDDETLILILGPLVDTTGRVTLANSLCSTITSAANGPTIMPGEHFIGCGIIGGVLRDFTVVGRRIATDVFGPPERFRGAIKTLPVAEFTTTEFDARQLERWGVSESRLPPGSRILYRRPSLWRDYRSAVVLGITAIVLQSALIAGLLYHRRRRRLAEQASRHDLALAARAARLTAIGELTASIAHELAQPLGAILHNVEAVKLMLASDGSANEEITTILDDVSKQDNRARDILSRIRRLVQKREPEALPLDLNAIALDTVQLLSHEAIARGVDIHCDLTAAPCVVLGDRVRLQQVLVNLLLNAMEAMAASPQADRRVAVRTTADAGRIELSVSDHGPGFDPKAAARLFEPFVTTKPQGLGIGLAIAHRIVTAHGGDITIANEPAGGATARVMLPAYAAAAAWM